MTWRTHLLGAAFAALVASASACGDDAVPYVPTGPVGSGSGAPDAATTGGAAMCMDFMVGGPYGPFDNLCESAEGDAECLTCTRSSCCAEVEACGEDADGNCGCLLECFLDNCDPVQCLVDCGPNAQTDALIACVTDSCISVCI